MNEELFNQLKKYVEPFGIQIMAMDPARKSPEQAAKYPGMMTSLYHPNADRILEIPPEVRRSKNYIIRSTAHIPPDADFEAARVLIDKAIARILMLYHKASIGETQTVEVG